MTKTSITTAAISLLMGQVMTTAQSLDVYFGTYTSKDGSKGIYHSLLDPQTGELSDPELAATTPNPSFVVAKNNRLYAVSEEDKGMIKAFSIDPETRKLQLLNELPSGGTYPCHLAVGEKLLAAANYGDGSVIEVGLDTNGTLSSRAEIFRINGKGPNLARQSSSHAHWVDLPGNELWTVDLGSDSIIIRPKGQVPWEIKLSAGAGPRHIARSPDQKYIYVINELDNTIAVIKDRTIIQTISTLPDDYRGESACAAIRMHPSGNFLYASNRGHDSIVRFIVDPASGMLSAKEFENRGVRWPRDFNITPDGRFCLIANEKSDSVIVFSIDQNNGKLTPNGARVAIKSPTCIQFLHR